MSIISQFFPTPSGGGATGSGNGVSLEMLLISGGGGAGGPYPIPQCVATGGGGAMEYVNGWYVAPGTTLYVTVGSGGASGAAFPSPESGVGSNGGCTMVVNCDSKERFMVIGGGGGGQNSLGANGGTGGGGPSTINCAACGAYFLGRFCTTSQAPTTLGCISIEPQSYLPTRYGFKGGFPALGPNNDELAGGGAGNSIYRCKLGPVPAPVGCVGTPSANDFLSCIEGTLKTYGGGGHLFDTRYPMPSPSCYDPFIANTGFGGRTTGCAGGSGTVVIKYPDMWAAADPSAYPGAVDISPATPGYRTYKFTSSGSITLP